MCQGQAWPRVWFYLPVAADVLGTMVLVRNPLPLQLHERGASRMHKRQASWVGPFFLAPMELVDTRRGRELDVLEPMACTSQTLSQQTRVGMFAIQDSRGKESLLHGPGEVQNWVYC